MTQPTTLLEATLITLLTEKKQTLSVAESCTGGLLGHYLTNVAGSSTAFTGGVIAYANAVKEGVLGVKTETLIQHGAVSEETACEMAEGVRRLLTTDYALSVTGVAGPGGGSPEKPVGLVYIGLATPQQTTARHYLWQSDRQGNKEDSAQAALTWLHEVLTSSD